MHDDIFEHALADAIHRAGSQTGLARETGISQSRISDYMRGRYEWHRLPVETLYKLFPEMRIVFFEDKEVSLNRSLEDEVIRRYRRLSPDEKLRLFALLENGDLSKPLH